MSVGTLGYCFYSSCDIWSGAVHRLMWLNYQSHTGALPSLRPSSVPICDKGSALRGLQAGAGRQGRLHSV